MKIKSIEIENDLYISRNDLLVLLQNLYCGKDNINVDGFVNFILRLEKKND